MTWDTDKLVDAFKPVANEMEASIKAKCPKLNREERLLIMAMSLWAGAKELAAENAELQTRLAARDSYIAMFEEKAARTQPKETGRWSR